jgi:hypothetical protein
MNSGTTSGMRNRPGTTCSIIGASQSPARNPSTTLGSAAITSTTGFT